MVSLVGRFFRAFMVTLALFALIPPLPGQAAPYAAIIMDARTGEELWSTNADTKLHPASLTKMMTLYVTFQEIQAGRLSLDTEVTVSKSAAAQPPSRLGLRPGQRIKVRYLIRAAAIKSANDAAAALGDHISGSTPAFAERMTRTARALGMRNTTFKNAHGLTAQGHLSTARDMTLLGRHLFYDFPQFYNIFSRRTADAGIAKVNNTNTRFLDAYDGADGIKTGYTVAAGFNLTASAKRGNKRIIATVFGGTSTAQRNGKMVELMNKGFGLAGERVRERRPDAAPLPEKSAPIPREDIEALVAEAAANAPVAAAKTLRVSGEVLRSPRPRLRPDSPAPAAPEALLAEAAPAAPVVPDALSAAIAEGVESALAEAVAAPPPPNSFEAQALALADPAAPAPAEGAGAAEAATAAPAPNSFEAQALALADGSAAAPAPEEEAADAQLATLAAMRPRARPDSLPEAVAVAEAEAEAEAAPEAALAAAEMPADVPALTEEVAPAAAEPAAELLLAAAPPPAPALPQPEAVAASADMAPAEEMLAEAAVLQPELVAEEPQRRAPIFDSVELAAASADEAGAERVVVAKSTSGGRAWGVAVGAFNSRYEAERALLKTGLAESATLEQGLQKVTESKGKYRATFLGLTEEQASLACRRIRARGVSCEATGPA